MGAQPGVFALVPARSGSKGVADKNLRPLAGRSLVARAADAIAAAGMFDRAILSTDSDGIADEGRSAGLDVPGLRPAELAGDETPMIDVVRHVLAEVPGDPEDLWALVQPTSPLREGADLAEAIALLRDTGADAVVSVTALPPHHSPDYVMRLDGDRLVPFLPEGERVARRQDARTAYVRNGVVYAFRRRTVDRYGTIYGEDCRPLVIEGERGLSIDTEEDWLMTEMLLLADELDEEDFADLLAPPPKPTKRKKSR